jgi:hypothetical protein
MLPIGPTRRVVHLVALWAFGVTQPVFSMLGANPEFIAVRGSTRGDLVLFALSVALVPPLVVVGVEALLARWSDALADALHVVATWACISLAAIQVLRLLDPVSPTTLLLPASVGLVGATAYLRLAGVRTFVTVSVALPLVAVPSFLVAAPVAVDDRPGALAHVGRPTPVVLLVLDELPLSSLLTTDGSLDVERYPNIGRLARDATWFRRATTVHEGTTHAVPAILTGRLPEDGALPTLADHPENLFTLLGERYALQSYEQVTRLCPTRYCPRTRERIDALDRHRGLLYDVGIAYLHRSLPTRIAGDLPSIGQRWGGFDEDAEGDAREHVLGALNDEAWLRAAAHAREGKRSQFEQFVRSIEAPRRRPTLYFEHALLPHTPWRFLPSGRQYANADEVAGIDEDWKRWRHSPQLVNQALQRHLLQVGYTDRLIGTLVRRLETEGLWDRALVIVTADHGASFRPGGYMREVDTVNVADIAAVPLFVKFPGRARGRIDDRDARTIDVLPTIADVLDLEIPWSVDGTSLRDTPIRRPVAVARGDGGLVTARADVVARRLLATARRNAQLFGTGDDSLYRFGVRRELLGREVATLGPEVHRVRMVLAENGRLRHVRRASGVVPVRIAGHVSGAPLPDGTPLVIALNGVVSALTVSFERFGVTRFAALVPEDDLREGENTIGVYSLPARGAEQLQTGAPRAQTGRAEARTAGRARTGALEP